MQVYAETITIPTQGQGTYELTQHVKSALKSSAINAGQVTVFVQHTSCSLVLMENADPSARHDLHEFIKRLVPEHTPYFTHTYEGGDDMPSHIKMVLTGCSEVIPIVDGALALGAWQGIFLFEHRHAPQRRRVVLNILGI